jgi:DNA-binding NarL/FixJ family response regulator
MKALVVEDFKLISLMWVKVLTGLGYNPILTAEHADEVMPAVDNLQPDLIFMDINIPGNLNGLDLTEMIISKYPNTKIIVLSIHTEPSYIERAFNAGAKGYITKNSPISEIKEAIDIINKGENYICKEISETPNN